MGELDPMTSGPRIEDASTARRRPRKAFINATEMYLRAIYELEEENGCPPKPALLRERLGVSRSAVIQRLRHLDHDGLACSGPNRTVVLTNRGLTLASRVARKHRLAERLLVDVVGLDWELAHTEANRWQHVLSDDVERRLLGLLEHPEVSPYGNPIPALHELRPGQFETRCPLPAAGVSCGHLARLGGGSAVIQQMTEGVQARADVLAALRVAGILPGETVIVRGGTGADGDVELRSPTRTAQVDEAAAECILVVGLTSGTWPTPDPVFRRPAATVNGDPHIPWSTRHGEEAGPRGAG